MVKENILSGPTVYQEESNQFLILTQLRPDAINLTVLERESPMLYHWT
jgi:hypothetical protein